MIGYHRHPPSLASTCAARGEAPGPHRVQVLGAQVRGVVLGSAWPQARSAASQKLCSTADRQQHSCTVPPLLPSPIGQGCAASGTRRRPCPDAAGSRPAARCISICRQARQTWLGIRRCQAGSWLAVQPLPEQQEPTYCCWGGGGCRGASSSQTEGGRPSADKMAAAASS